MKIKLHLLYVIGVVLVCGNAYAQREPVALPMDAPRMNEPENLNVFQQWIRWNNGGSLLMNHLIKQAFHLYEIRDGDIARLKTKADWLQRQQDVKARLMEITGPFPEKTPLNPVVTGTIKKEGYRIEKIVYESMPGFYVTGCLFIPAKIKGRAPAVLNVIGHEQISYKEELDQVIILNLVKKGIVVFTIDPIGQGEHVQYFEPEINFSSIGYSVIEHCYFGNQCFLSGVSPARYFIWDGIRAIDYLITRKEVDPGRIGVTGFSGGGTVTAYLGAFDDRVKVAIPSSWSIAARRQVETKGAQDAEATLPQSVAKGITFEDLIEVRAPKPTMMTFVSRDEYLCLQGAREAYEEAKKVYEIFGRPDDLQLVEDDSKHWLTPRIRLAIYSFFMKHFGLPGDPSESDVQILKPEELHVTQTGQISTSLGGEMVFDVNKKETLPFIQKLEASRSQVANHLAAIPGKAKQISGYETPVVNGKQPFINGRYRREGYTVTKFAIEGEGEYVIPFLLFEPVDHTAGHPAIIYLHPKGKITEAAPGGEIERLVKKGYVVAAADVLGVGETANTAARGLASGYMAVLIGRSIVGIQAADVVRVANYLKTNGQTDPEKIGAIAFGEMCLPLIHAAAFEPSIKTVTLVDPLVSYRSVVMNRKYMVGLTDNDPGGVGHPYEVAFDWGIANVLTAYDLPDLIGCLAPRKVVIAQPRDQMLKPASAELLNEELAFPRSAYAFMNAIPNLKVLQDVQAADDLVDWTFK
ncbi:MAG TPA: alpha/beta hydrolase family protein [Chryseosolibacter sp.]